MSDNFDSERDEIVQAQQDQTTQRSFLAAMGRPPILKTNRGDTTEQPRHKVVTMHEKQDVTEGNRLKKREDDDDDEDVEDVTEKVTATKKTFVCHQARAGSGCRLL